MFYTLNSLNKLDYSLGAFLTLRILFTKSSGHLYMRSHGKIRLKI